MSKMAKKLVALRKSRSYSRKKAAALIGVPETTYREWEYGREIRGEPYSKIAKAFDVSLGDLLDDTPSSFSIETRLMRVIDDLTVIHSEIRKSKK